MPARNNSFYKLTFNKEVLCHFKPFTARLSMMIHKRKDICTYQIGVSMWWKVHSLHGMVSLPPAWGESLLGKHSVVSLILRTSLTMPCSSWSQWEGKKNHTSKWLIQYQDFIYGGGEASSPNNLASHPKRTTISLHHRQKHHMTETQLLKNNSIEIQIYAVHRTKLNKRYTTIHTNWNGMLGHTSSTASPQSWFSRWNTEYVEMWLLFSFYRMVITMLTFMYINLPWHSGICWQYLAPHDHL